MNGIKKITIKLATRSQCRLNGYPESHGTAVIYTYVDEDGFDESVFVWQGIEKALLEIESLVGLCNYD